MANLHSLDPPDDFYFQDELFHMTLAVRSKDVGVIVAFEDGRINAESYGKYLDDVDGRKLHPIQFDELYAKVDYNTRRLNRVPKYIFAMQDDATKPFQVVMLPLGGMSAKPVVDEWVQADFAPLLAVAWEKWGFEPAFLFEPPDLVRSFMQGEDGTLLLLDEHGETVECD